MPPWAAGPARPYRPASASASRSSTGTASEASVASAAGNKISSASRCAAITTVDASGERCVIGRHRSRDAQACAGVRFPAVPGADRKETTVAEGEAIVLETERLILRRLTMDDVDALAEIYRDPEVRRYFPEGTLTEQETRDEVAWIIDVYEARFGFGLWATILKETGAFIGRCGLLPWTALEGPDGGLTIQHVAERPPEPPGAR